LNKLPAQPRCEDVIMMSLLTIAKLNSIDHIVTLLSHLSHHC